MPASAARRSSKPHVSPSAKEETARARIDIAEAGQDAAPSPARVLQVRLEHDLQADALGRVQAGRWPLYAALTFWVGISSLMWAAIVGSVWILLRHI
jgi:hypothetical protein